jgi:hypothetical protein
MDTRFVDPGQDLFVRLAKSDLGKYYAVVSLLRRLEVIRSVDLLFKKRGICRKSSFRSQAPRISVLENFKNLKYLEDTIQADMHVKYCMCVQNFVKHIFSDMISRQTEIYGEQ